MNQSKMQERVKGFILGHILDKYTTHVTLFPSDFMWNLAELFMWLPCCVFLPRFLARPPPITRRKQECGIITYS